MKPLHLFIALLMAVVPAAAADQKKPPAKQTPAEKRKEAEKKKEEEKKKKDAEKKKDSTPKPEAKSGLPVRPEMSEQDMVTLLKPYDKDGDYQIDVHEFEAIDADFKKNSLGPLKQFDKAKDGKLDVMIDRAYMNVKLGGAAPKKGSGPAKKSEAPKPPAVPAPAPAPPAPPGTKKSL
jgi:LAS superfamily LD-carboxypeptidase LdcB